MDLVGFTDPVVGEFRQGDARSGEVDVVIPVLLHRSAEDPTVAQAVVDSVARLRADPRTRDLQVVFLTASAADFGPERARALGIRGVIAKPFDPQALAENLTRLLRD